jgi:YHS domain-containing protein
MKHLTLTLILTLLVGFLFAQTDEARKKSYNVSKKAVAIQGYDPVSYFDNKPTEGKSSLVHVHQGITYYFSTQANLAKFKASPEKYEPVYGGWCAYAMGENGEKVEVDPETFKILDGKLNLFYNSWGNNTLTKWNKNEKALKTKADQNWKKFAP